ncbi:MAG: hypothetical protein PVG89_15470, partial [Gammaproteobacteria bacterium]
MTDINNIDNGLQSTSQTAAQSRSTVKDVQHWDYQWEKAFLELENAQNQQAAASDTKDGKSTEEGNHSNSSKNSVDGAHLSRQPADNNVIDEMAANQPMHKPAAVLIRAAGSNITDPALVRTVLPQQGILMPSAGVIPTMGGGSNGSQNVNTVEQPQSPQWQVVAKVQPAKTGLVVYKGVDNQV